jgi:hypothetical protein
VALVTLGSPFRSQCFLEAVWGVRVSGFSAETCVCFWPILSLAPRVSLWPSIKPGVVPRSISLHTAA